MSIPRGNVRLAPIHPGEILREEFMAPLSLSANALALALHVPATRISEIVNERRGITPDTALRLGLYFGTTPELWLGLQSNYDLSVTSSESLSQLKKQVRPRPGLKAQTKVA